jgi:hypothetical protein
MTGFRNIAIRHHQGLFALKRDECCDCAVAATPAFGLFPLSFSAAAGVDTGPTQTPTPANTALRVACCDHAVVATERVKKRETTTLALSGSGSAILREVMKRSTGRRGRPAPRLFTNPRSTAD